VTGRTAPVPLRSSAVHFLSLPIIGCSAKITAEGAARWIEQQLLPQPGSAWKAGPWVAFPLRAQQECVLPLRQQDIVSPRNSVTISTKLALGKNDRSNATHANKRVMRSHGHRGEGAKRRVYLEEDRSVMLGVECVNAPRAPDRLLAAMSATAVSYQAIPKREQASSGEGGRRTCREAKGGGARPSGSQSSRPPRCGVCSHFCRSDHASPNRPWCSHPPDGDSFAIPRVSVATPSPRSRVRRRPSWSLRICGGCR
jgi:hypothetical protein